MDIIGTNALAYPQLRAFGDLRFKKYRIEERFDVFKIAVKLGFRFGNGAHPYFLNSFYRLGSNKCDLYHFFNTISYGKKPWITSFETSIPRWGMCASKRKNRKGLELIAGDSCKKIIAISECTANIQRQFIMDNAPELFDVITSKMEIIHPAQKMLASPIIKKSADKIAFTIVGSLFIGKGGKEILNVFNRIIPKYSHVQLNIVSSLLDANKEDFNWCMSIIKKYPNNIQYFETLPNHEVLELFKSSHVGLLPTHAETYGFSVLEAQASGCPVISTDIRALPETNADDRGWLINVPKDSLGFALQGPDLSCTIEEQLHEIVQDILDNPAMISVKGEKAVERIKEYHCPEIVTNRIESIYDSALQKTQIAGTVRSINKKIAVNDDKLGVEVL